MPPFAIQIRMGEPIADQIVFAAVRAILAGELDVGEAFPSVRSLAGDLGAHPNTVHKAMLRLIAEGWLETRPGVGAFVAKPPTARSGEQARLVEQDVEKLVVEARRVGMDLETLIEATRLRWRALEGKGE